MEGIGARIKQLRNEKGLNQKQLAEILEVDQTSLSNYENEKRRIDASVITEICHVFDVTSDWLLGLSDKKAPKQDDITEGLTDQEKHQLESFAGYLVMTRKLSKQDREESCTSAAIGGKGRKTS